VGWSRGRSGRVTPIQAFFWREGQTQQATKGQGDQSGKERTYLTLEKKRKEPTNPEITISQAKESVSPINISISSQDSQTEIIKLREILLTDSSVEAS